MANRANFYASDWVTVSAEGEDILSTLATSLGVSTIVTKKFEFFAQDDIEININNQAVNSQLKAGDKLEFDMGDLGFVTSCKIYETDKTFRYVVYM